MNSYQGVRLSFCRWQGGRGQTGVLACPPPDQGQNRFDCKKKRSSPHLSHVPCLSSISRAGSRATWCSLSMVV